VDVSLLVILTSSRVTGHDESDVVLLSVVRTDMRQDSAVLSVELGADTTTCKNLTTVI